MQANEWDKKENAWTWSSETAKETNSSITLLAGKPKMPLSTKKPLFTRLLRINVKEKNITNKLMKNKKGTNTRRGILVSCSSG